MTITVPWRGPPMTYRLRVARAGRVTAFWMQKFDACWTRLSPLYRTWAVLQGWELSRICKVQTKKMSSQDIQQKVCQCPTSTLVPNRVLSSPNNYFSSSTHVLVVTAYESSELSASSALTDEERRSAFESKVQKWKNWKAYSQVNANSVGTDSNFTFSHVVYKGKLDLTPKQKLFDRVFGITTKNIYAVTPRMFALRFLGY